MTIYDDIFPLGIGTNRFLCHDVDDAVEIEKAAKMVACALERGMSYVDVAATYSKGTAVAVCKKAFQMTNANKNVTIKSSYLKEKTTDDALRCVDTVFDNLGIDHAAYFVLWNIASYEQFIDIMRRGSLYEGVMKAKERGLVDHICFSTHAPPQEMIRMLESGAFEGVTISLNPMNANVMQPVLACAERNNIGVVVMNPLGGGLVPQREEYFRFLQYTGEESVNQAALRYIYAHPAVKVILSGISKQEELDENYDAFKKNNPELNSHRLLRVNNHFEKIDGFCTGCRYCDGCPQDLPIYELMQSYNTTLFPSPKKQYGKQNPKLLENIGICSRMKNTFGIIPETSQNRCIECGLCESNCTAHLPIRQRIKQLYEVFSLSCFSKEDMRIRLKNVIGNSKTVGFYPAGGYTAYVLGLLKEAFGNQQLDISLYDSNPKLWGTKIADIEIRTPDDIRTDLPECIVVSSYNYSDEIYDKLKYLKEYDIRVEKLHSEMDVPWVF